MILCNLYESFYLYLRAGVCKRVNEGALCHKPLNLNLLNLIITSTLLIGPKIFQYTSICFNRNISLDYDP